MNTAIQGMSGGGGAAIMGGVNSAMGKITHPASEVARLMFAIGTDNSCGR